MTPKEKAEELVSKYKKLKSVSFSILKKEVLDNVAKLCALIAVDEILSEFMFDDSDYSNRRYKYYQEVKKELEETSTQQTLPRRENAE